jgi:hypothetical protein
MQQYSGIAAVAVLITVLHGGALQQPNGLTKGHWRC